MRRRRYTHVCAQALNISLQCITLHYGAEQQSTVHRLLARDWYSTVRKGLERGRGVIVDYLQHNKTAYLSHTTSPGQQQIHISSILRRWTWKLLRKLLGSNSSSNPQLTYIYINLYISVWISADPGRRRRSASEKRGHDTRSKNKNK